MEIKAKLQNPNASTLVSSHYFYHSNFKFTLTFTLSLLEGQAGDQGNILTMYRGADKSLARPTSRCILFDGENISFDASLVIYIYINSTNIPPIMIINTIYETQNLLSL